MKTGAATGSHPFFVCHRQNWRLLRVVSSAAISTVRSSFSWRRNRERARGEAQKGKCSVSGELFLNPDNIVCHLKVPKEQGGQERYSNLVLLHRRYLPLLADQNATALKSICKQLAVTRKQLTKINNLRTAAKLAAI